MRRAGGFSVAFFILKMITIGRGMGGGGHLVSFCKKTYLHPCSLSLVDLILGP